MDDVSGFRAGWALGRFPLSVVVWHETRGTAHQVHLGSVERFVWSPSFMGATPVEGFCLDVVDSGLSCVDAAPAHVHVGSVTCDTQGRGVNKKCCSLLHLSSRHSSPYTSGPDV